MLTRILSYYQTSAPMPHITVEHPIQNVGPGELVERAQQIVNAAIEMLNGVD